MPIVRMRVTPAARAAATSSASGAGPRSRWVWVSITAGLGNSGGQLRRRVGAARPVAEAARSSSVVPLVRAERAPAASRPSRGM